jgi:hypothetical protein
MIRVADQLDLPGSSQVIDDTLNALSGQTQPSRGTGDGARSVRRRYVMFAITCPVTHQRSLVGMSRSCR